MSLEQSRRHLLNLLPLQAFAAFSKGSNVLNMTPAKLWSNSKLATAVLQYHFGAAPLTTLVIGAKKPRVMKTLLSKTFLSLQLDAK